MELYKLGSRGEVVRQIQKALAGAGLGVIPDGIFGNITRDAIIAFQREHNLTPDGVVGPATLALLIPERLKKSKRTIKEIIIHCTATPEGQDKTVEQIRAEHMAPVSKGGRGWSDIGYHYVIYRNGHVMPGRDIDKIGAHATDHNTYSIGIAYVGGVEYKHGVPYAQLKHKDTRTLSQRASLLTLLTDLRAMYPTARIVSHRDCRMNNGRLPNKACPSFDATKEYRDI